MDVIRFDTADFPERLELVATPGAAHPGWLRTQERPVDLSRVTGVYRRSPAVFGFADGMSPPERRFALMEAVQGLGGVLATLRCRWMNHPSRVADASYKPMQLRTAQDSGLRVPRTLVTNVGSAARMFIEELDGAAIYKPMSPGVLSEQGKIRVINASIVDHDMVDDSTIMRTAHTFQQYIDKSHDARVTVVGDQLFGVAIHAENDVARIDWRADYDALRYELSDVPVDVRSGILEYMERLDLLFAAFDFSVGKDGLWWFLEANANGLWAWLQERLNIQIADAVADVMAREGN